MQFDVFISYSHEDKAAADAACATLEQAGIRCWISPRDIVPGMDWSESIINAIERAKLMVLIFSGHANESPQIKREVPIGDDGLMIRTGPHETCRQVGAVPPHARDVIEHWCQRSPLDVTTWCKITFGAISGWVPDGFLERQN